ncbi:MAG TPA: hypothetical protein VH252_04650, partial [Chthoniobacterales bacterium]|nr:hypothetical protein [Chthoniobacterales bacterium]
TVALAAIVIVFVTLTSVLLANYFRHERIRQAEEPIGVPVGVPETAASPPPVVASAPSVAPAPPRPLPENTAPIIAAQENQPPAKKETPPTVAANEQQPPSNVAPVPSEPPKIVATESKVVEEKSDPPAQPKIAANQPTVAEEKSSAPESPKFTSNESKVTEEKSSTAEPPKIAANEPKIAEEKSAATELKKSARTEVHEEKTERMPETAIARPVSPEVRRAEPAPAEGPEDAAPAPEKKVAPATLQKERVKKPRREFVEGSIPRAEPADEEEEVFPSQAPQVEQLPRGRTRAKFIGVTADGNWMFSLPNKKIVIVPPPPGG